MLLTHVTMLAHGDMSIEMYTSTGVVMVTVSYSTDMTPAVKRRKEEGLNPCS